MVSASPPDQPARRERTAGQRHPPLSSLVIAGPAAASRGRVRSRAPARAYPDRLVAIAGVVFAACFQGGNVMTTSKKSASIASKELSSKSSSKGEKTVAGSDLSQAKKPSA